MIIMYYLLEPFTDRLKRSKYIKALNKSLICVNLGSYYNHVTFTINSLAEYIQVITAIANVHHEKSNTTKKVYRGMADSDWKLVPSLARGLEKSKNSYCPEYDMVSEMISEKPNEFKNLSYNLEVLSKMQHYGLPTRLLDFSLSPLIALYFACCEKLSKSGRVVVGEAKILHYNEPIIEAICGLYKLPYCENILIDDWLIKYSIEPEDYLRIIYKYYNEPLLTFVKPLYINERMRIQQSVFAVFTNEITDIGARVTYYDWQDSPYYNEEIEKYENIETIYNDLIGDEDTPFWLNSEKVDNIWERYKNEDNATYNVDLLEKMLKSRFGLSEGIRLMEPYDIFSNFCSIIIDKTSKKNIINELAQLGIDGSFVYPELEYTAEKVKKKVMG